MPLLEAKARVNTGVTDVSLGRDDARNAVTRAGRRCQVCNATDADCRKSFGRDRSDYAIPGAPQYQARTDALASARVIGNINISFDLDSARNAVMRSRRPPELRGLWGAC